MSNIFKHLLCTLHGFPTGKARFIHTITVTRSQPYSGKKYAYASRASCFK